MSINHVRGAGSSNRPFAISWFNEYWLSIATETSGNFSIQYVKSWVTNKNPNAWNPLYGINIRSLFRDGTSTLYGGSASSGTFYRLDFGTNDDGQAIDAHYDTPSLTFGNDFNDKTLLQISVDADREAGGNLQVGYSTGSSVFNFDTVSLDGTGGLVKTLQKYNKTANEFQFRVRNNQLDKGLNFNTLGLTYVPTEIRSDR